MKQLSRRKFLRGAALTGILMGANSGSRAGSRREGRGTRDAQRPGEHRPDRLRSIANYYHSNALKRMEDVRVVAACDAYGSRREALATLYNKHYGDSEVTKTHADFREVLARPDVDAVIIAAHDNWHTPMSIAAVNAGKDVYCQKPLALDFSLTGLLRKAVAKQGIAQWGNRADDTSPVRYEGKGNIPDEGIYRTLEHWDVKCRYANGVMLHFMEEEIVGDNPEASKLLSLSYREKWRVW